MGNEPSTSAHELPARGAVRRGRSTVGNRLRKIFELPRALRDRAESTHDVLTTLKGRLGLSELAAADTDQNQAAPVVVYPSRQVARPVFYTPDIDGYAEAGEIVWLWAPVDGPDNPPIERAMLVVGRSAEQHLLGLLISQDDQPSKSCNWAGVGTGEWNPTGKPGWARLDKVIDVPEHAVRREGALLPERRFEQVAQQLRANFGWA